jgi:RNA polymerase sigma factor (sigma-70 family)
VNDLTDPQLLQDYAEHGSEPAFAELVRRHVDLVYSAALRMVRDSHLAEDIAQSVFIALAKNAALLANRPVLSGWLHVTARNFAVKTIRSDVRRRAREHEAAAINELPASGPDAAWEHIVPELDAVLGELSEPDRDALLLRYFERKSAREMAATLGTSEEAAQKRVHRAVERLRDLFTRRGVTASASGLAAVLSANAVQGAPAGLAATISTAAVVAGKTIATTAAITTGITMTTLQKTLIATALAAALGAGIYQAVRAWTWRDRAVAFQQHETRLTDQIQQLTAANETVVARLNDQSNEVAQLNETIAQLRNELKSAAGSASVRRRGILPAALTNFVASGIAMQKKEWEDEAMAELATMRDRVNLTAEQEKSIRELMLRRVDVQTKLYANGFTDNFLSLDEVEGLRNAQKEVEPQIRSLLTSDQLTAYLQFKQDTAVARGRVVATSRLAELQSTFNLAAEQQDQIFPVLYILAVSDISENLINPTASYQEEVTRYYTQSTNRLNQELTILKNALTGSQLEKLEKYRESRQRSNDDIKRTIEMLQSAMKPNDSQ